MALITLTVWPFTHVTNVQGLGESLATYDLGAGYTLTGGATYDACLAADNDGKYISQVAAFGGASFFWFFQNLDASSASIPLGSTINSVTFQCRLRTVGGSINIRTADTAGFTYSLGANGSNNQSAVDLFAAPADPVTAAAFTTYATTALTINPVTSVAWILSDLLANDPNNADDTVTGGYWFWSSPCVTAASVDIDSFFLVVDYTPPTPPNTWNLSTTFAAPAGFLPAGAGHSATVAVPINVQGGTDVLNQPSSGVLPGQPLQGVGTPNPTPGLLQNPRQGVPPTIGNRQANGSAGYSPAGGLNLPDANQFRLERFDAKYRPEEHL